MSSSERYAWSAVILALVVLQAVRGWPQGTTSITAGTSGAGISSVNTAVGATGTYGTVSVAATGTGTQIRAANANRLSLVIQNMCSNYVAIATDTSIATSSGTILGPTTGSGNTITPGGSITIDRYTGLVQGLSSSGACDVRYLETAR